MSNSTPQASGILRLTSLEELRLFFDPVRQHILRELTAEPRTVQSVANAMGVPFKRLYYQFTLLEKAGFIHVVRVHAFSGAVDEKYYQTVGQQVWINEELLRLDDSGDDGLGTMLSAVLDETKSAIRRSVQEGKINLNDVKGTAADGADNPHAAQLLIERRLARMTVEQADALYDQIIALIEAVETQAPDATMNTFGITLALYPAPDDEA
jgi:hypothetical protein